MPKTVVINCLAGPGAGKSTVAAGIFHRLKTTGASVELVIEYAKELTYEGRSRGLANQLSILGEQFARLERLRGVVDYIVTDSPLIFSAIYADGPFKSAWFQASCFGAFETFDNLNFFIERRAAYQTVGRNQTEEEALEVDRRVRGMLDGLRIPYTAIPGDADAVDVIERALARLKREVQS